MFDFDFNLGIELNWIAVVLSLVLSGIFIGIMWNIVAYSLFNKIILSIVLPVLSYVIIVRKLNS